MMLQAFININKNISVIKKLQYNFTKVRDGVGSKAVWMFSKKSSDLVAPPFPYVLFHLEAPLPFCFSTFPSKIYHIYDLSFLCCMFPKQKPSLCQKVFGLPHLQQVEVGKVDGDDRKGKADEEDSRDRAQTSNHFPQTCHRRYVSSPP